MAFARIMANNMMDLEVTDCSLLESWSLCNLSAIWKNADRDKQSPQMTMSYMLAYFSHEVCCSSQITWFIVLILYLEFQEPALKNKHEWARLLGMLESLLKTANNFCCILVPLFWIHLEQHLRHLHCTAHSVPSLAMLHKKLKKRGLTFHTHILTKGTHTYTRDKKAGHGHWWSCSCALRYLLHLKTVSIHVSLWVWVHTKHILDMFIDWAGQQALMSYCHKSTSSCASYQLCLRLLGSASRQITMAATSGERTNFSNWLDAFASLASSAWDPNCTGENNHEVYQGPFFKFTGRLKPNIWGFCIWRLQHTSGYNPPACANE